MDENVKEELSESQLDETGGGKKKPADRPDINPQMEMELRSHFEEYREKSYDAEKASFEFLRQLRDNPGLKGMAPPRLSEVIRYFRFYGGFR